MMADSSGRGRPLAHAVAVLGAGAAGAAALGALHVPAGVLLGSVLGSALANRAMSRSSEPRSLPPPVRTVGLVLLGCAVAVRLDGHTLSTLGHIALPLLAGIALLLLLDVALACLLVVRYDVDAMTAVLACAPGGVSGIAITADQMGARMGVVLAIHTVRVLAVVLAALPLLVAWLG